MERIKSWKCCSVCMLTSILIRGNIFKSSVCTWAVRLQSQVCVVKLRKAHGDLYGQALMPHTALWRPPLALQHKTTGRPFFSCCFCLHSFCGAAVRNGFCRTSNGFLHLSASSGIIFLRSRYRWCLHKLWNIKPDAFCPSCFVSWRGWTLNLLKTCQNYQLKRLNEAMTVIIKTKPAPTAALQVWGDMKTSTRQVKVSASIFSATCTLVLFKVDVSHQHVGILKLLPVNSFNPTLEHR